MKLSIWAKNQGISYLTAYRWFKAGKIENAKQFDSGTIMVMDENIGIDRKDEIKNDLKKIEALVIEINKKLDK